MEKRFQDIYTEVLTQVNTTETSEDTTVLDSIKLRINQIQSWLVYRKPYEWRKRPFYMGAIPPDEITVTITQGSKSVTVDSGSVSAYGPFGYLLISNIAYKIDPHTAISSTFRLMAAFPKTSVAAQSAKIIYPVMVADTDMAAPVSVRIEGVEKNLLNTQRVAGSKNQTGTPYDFYVAGVADFDFYSTGTAGVTQDSKSVTGSGTAFSALMEGMPFRIDEFSVPYFINTRVSDEAITLREKYQGATGSGKTYKVSPIGSLLIGMSPAPDARYFIEIEGLIKPRTLVRPNDVSILPDHTPLLYGAIYLALLDREDKNPVRIQQAKADFEDSIRQFDDVYKPIADQKWISAEEISSRKWGSTMFDPLRRGH